MPEGPEVLGPSGREVVARAGVGAGVSVGMVAGEEFGEGSMCICSGVDPAVSGTAPGGSAAGMDLPRPRPRPRPRAGGILLLKMEFRKVEVYDCLNWWFGEFSGEIKCRQSCLLENSLR